VEIGLEALMENDMIAVKKSSQLLHLLHVSSHMKSVSPLDCDKHGTSLRLELRITAAILEPSWHSRLTHAESAKFICTEALSLTSKEAVFDRPTNTFCSCT